MKELKNKLLKNIKINFTFFFSQVQSARYPNESSCQVHRAKSVLKQIFPGVRGLSPRFVRRFCSSKRSIFSRVSTEKVTEMVMEASSKLIPNF